MSDAIPCAHLPTTGAVYRVQILRVVTTRDAPVQRYTVCAGCYDRMRAILPAEPVRAPEPAPEPQGEREQWYITEHAARCFARLSYDARGQRAPRLDDISDQEWLVAQTRLRELAPTATYRERDRQGRTLWRSPPSALGLRWVLDQHRVIWVGASRPPERMWEP